MSSECLPHQYIPPSPIKKLGAGHVILTDNDPKSITHMLKGTAANGIDSGVVSLDWFSPIDGIKALNIEVAESGGSMCVVAGDVLNKKKLLEPFMDTARALLHTVPASEMLLCHVPRVGIMQEDILARAHTAGLAVEEIDSGLWRKGSCTEYSPAEDDDSARLYKLHIKYS
jgi:hypothetical protein